MSRSVTKRFSEPIYKLLVQECESSGHNMSEVIDRALMSYVSSGQASKDRINLECLKLRTKSRKRVG